MLIDLGLRKKEKRFRKYLICNKRIGCSEKSIIN